MSSSLTRLMILTCSVLCAATASQVTGRPSAGSGSEWPQWRGPARDGVWKESGIVATLPKPAIPIKWRVPISSGYCGPTVAGGRVYVMDRVTAPKSGERILCFDAKSGKPRWNYAYDCEYGP